MADVQPFSVRAHLASFRRAITAKEVAEILNLQLKTVFKMSARGTLPLTNAGQTK